MNWYMYVCIKTYLCNVCILPAISAHQLQLKCMSSHFFPCHPYIKSTTILSDNCCSSHDDHMCLCVCVCILYMQVWSWMCIIIIQVSNFFCVSMALFLNFFNLWIVSLGGYDTIYHFSMLQGLSTKFVSTCLFIDTLTCIREC